MKCVIGYIKCYMHEYSSEHNRLVLQIIGFWHNFAKIQYFPKVAIKKRVFASPNFIKFYHSTPTYKGSFNKDNQFSNGFSRIWDFKVVK